MWNMNIEFNPEHVQPFSLNSELREKDRERKTQNKWKNKTKHDSEETNNSRQVQKESGEAWPSHLDQIQHSQVQLRWESRVRLRHDSLTPNLEILIFSFPTEGKKLYLWEAFRQNRERCGRICFCQRGGCSTTCFFFFFFSPPSIFQHNHSGKFQVDTRLEKSRPKYSTTFMNTTPVMWQMSFGRLRFDWD